MNITSLAPIVYGWVLVILALTYQGVHILRTGQTDLFFVKPVDGQAPAGLVRRLSYACIYLFPAGGMTAILVSALAKSGASRLETWLANNFGMLFFSLCCAVVGLLLLLQPARMIRWTIRDRRELADDKSAVLVMRFLGVCSLGMGYMILRGS
jgi:hypothetical protein